MKKILFIFIVIFTFSAYLGVKLFWKIPQNVQLATASKVWKIQSIDTVKYTRDLAREKLKDTSFDTEIKKQVSDIAQTGATHIAFATPYNDEFVPYLKRWVLAARANNLRIWFRGNVAGWEGWFDYAKIGREEHTAKVTAFIEKYPELFEAGDLFTSCPECENGGPGDPRMTGDVTGFRQFLIDEHRAVTNSFKTIHKKVTSGFYSMNGDVAKLVMDEDTTRALGGIVTIDHYVSTPDKLISFVDEIASTSKGKIVLGEWGAPIPDINGAMTEDEQMSWILDSLNQISANKNIIGVNYWTNQASSTAIWNNDGTPRKAVAVLTGFYKPREIYGTIVNELGDAVYGAAVKTQNSTASTDYAGRFRLQVLPDDTIMYVEGVGYIPQTITVTDISNYSVTLVKQYENGVFRFAKWLHKRFTP